MNPGTASNFENTLRESAGCLAEDGFVLLDRLCASPLRQHLLQISRQRAHELKQALGDREIGIGSAAGYVEIVQRSPGRWDVPISPAEFGIRDREMPWWPLVAELLGDDAEHSFSGVVLSEPDSPAQCWHTDSPHEAAEHLAAHAINVLVALHDIPMLMGPTELARRSQVLTNHLANPSLVLEQLIYQHPDTSPQTLVKGTDLALPECFASPVSAGSCLVFDDRILHRGLANRSEDVRYVAYFSYRKSGYSSDTHFESQRSIFDQPG